MRRKTVTVASFVLLTLAAVASAQSRAGSLRSEATVTYDVKLREFRCWREGRLTEAARTAAASCQGHGWHPLTTKVYFVRGQAVNVLLVNAMAADLFAIDLTAEDLAEPAAPVLGSLASIPKMVPINPGFTVVAGNAAKFSGGELVANPADIYRKLATADVKDLSNWVKSALVAPLISDDVRRLLAIPINGATEGIKGTKEEDFKNGASAFGDEAQTLQNQVNEIAPPTTTRMLVDQTRALVALIEKQSALRLRLAASSVQVSAQTINDVVNSLNSPAIQEALGVDGGELAILVNHFIDAFPIERRYLRIQTIDVDKSKTQFVISNAKQPADALDFLRSVSAAAPQPLNADAVKRLKANLVALADIWSDVTAAKARADSLANVKAGATDSQKTIANLQKTFDKLADSTIGKAADLNEFARNLALDGDLQVLRVGQWFSSKTVTVTVKQGQRVAMFDLSGVSGSSRTPVAGGDNASDKSAAPVPAALTDVRTFQFPVYNMYRFQLGVGFLWSSARDDQFQADTVTIGAGDSATTQKFIDQTVSRSQTLLTNVALIVYPTRRHAFPWRARYAKEQKPAWYEDFGAMVGFSVTSPSKDILFGGAWFPRSSPVGLQIGWHIALRDYPPAGFDTSRPIPEDTHFVTLQQKRLNGVAAGLVFTTDFFTNVFASIFKQ